jgi:ABC-type transport system substrate-binding protein
MCCQELERHPPLHFSHGLINPDFTITHCDPDKSRKLLEHAGCMHNDGDRVRKTPDGLPIELRLYYQLGEAPELTVADTGSDYSGEIGIAVEFHAPEYGEMRIGVMEERHFEWSIHNNYTDAFGPGHALHGPLLGARRG